MYVLCLSACGNPDFGQNPYSSLGIPSIKVNINTLKEGRKIVNDYIHKYNLGGGNYNNGHVYTESGKYVGRFSYNGRFWDINDNPVKID